MDYEKEAANIKKTIEEAVNRLAMEKNKKRIGRHEYFMRMAELAARRSTCDRAHVGAIIVKDRNVIATGYNGSPTGMEHCDEVGHMIDRSGEHCIRTVHAEVNAIIQAAKHGHSVNGGSIYVTHKPCHNCCKFLINAGIKKVYFTIDYDDGFNNNYLDRLEFEQM